MSDLILAVNALIEGNKAESWRYPTVWDPLIQRLEQAAQATPPAAVVPKHRRYPPAASLYEVGYTEGWNECRQIMIAKSEEVGNESAHL